MVSLLAGPKSHVTPGAIIWQHTLRLELVSIWEATLFVGYVFNPSELE